MAFSAGSTPAAVAGTMDSIGSTSGPSQQQQHIAKIPVVGNVGFELQNTATGINIMNSSLSPADDIIKMGILRKGKKGKKRFFVLHQETYGKPARLDCYDSDKQYYKQRSSGGQPKLTIPMKTCFNINKRVDSKLKHCISLFTMNDVLLLGSENEQEQEAWLQTLLTVLRNTKCGFGQDDTGRLNYDFVWDVNILRDRGLTEKTPSLSGHYRLCMTHAAIFLYRKGEDAHSLEFPLVFIASYGCKASMWYLRVGRTAMTGSGELSMETEDPIIASNINETMKSILEENHDHRQRSTSIGDRRQGSAWGGRSASTTTASLLSSSSSTAASSTSLERSGSIGLNPQSRSRAISESEKTLQSVLNKTGGGYGITDNLFPLSMARKTSAPPPTGFLGDHRFVISSSFTSSNHHVHGPGSPKNTSRKASSGGCWSLRTHLAHPRGGVHPVNMADISLSAGSSTISSPMSPPSSSAGVISGAYSGRAGTAGQSPAMLHSQVQWLPPGCGPLATSPGYCSNEAIGVEHDHSMSRYFPRQAVGDRASSMEVVGTSIAEESSGSGAEYLPMQSSNMSGGDCGTRSSMSSRASSTNTVLMLQRTSTGPDQQGRSDSYVDTSTSDAVAAPDDRRRMTADSGYLEMARANTANHLPSSSSSDQVTHLAGYTPMGPGSAGRSSSSAHSRQTSWHLEEVRSYISDSDNSSCSAPPSRAWSLGSRPIAAADVGGGNACYTSMGPGVTTSGVSHTLTPSSAGPIAKFGLFITSRLGGGAGSADDRKRAHSVGSWNKPLWKRGPAISNLPPSDLGPSPGVDPNTPSTSSSFYRPRSESFGSARSTPGSRRLLDSGGSKLSNQSEDLVEMEFGRSSIGRSPSGSLGSSESITRSRASSVGGGGAQSNNANQNTGPGGGTGSMYGRQGWSPRVEQITEQEMYLNHSPSGKLIQLFQQQLATATGGVGAKVGEEYVPMGPSDEKPTDDYCAMNMGSEKKGNDDYCAMNMGLAKKGDTDYCAMKGTADYCAMTMGSEKSNMSCPGRGEDYVAMNMEPKPATGRVSVARQYSNPSKTGVSPASFDPAAVDSSTSTSTSSTTKCPVRHSSGSSNLSLGNSHCMGLDSGVGGSSFSLDQQKLESKDHQHHHVNVVSPNPLGSSKPKGRSLANLPPIEQLKERLARVEMASGDDRPSDDPYVQMIMPNTKDRSASTTTTATGISKPVRRSSSFAKGSLSSFQRGDAAMASQKSSPSQIPPPPPPQNQSTSRSPLMKMFASFGKGSTKYQQQPPPQTKSTSHHQSPTPSLKAATSTAGVSRSRTPSSSSKISVTDCAASRPQPRASVTSSSVDTESEEPVLLEYASLDLNQSCAPIPISTKTPSPRPSSSCSGGEGTPKAAPSTPALILNDGVVYAKIDAARTNAVVESNTLLPRQY